MLLESEKSVNVAHFMLLVNPFSRKDIKHAFRVLQVHFQVMSYNVSNFREMDEGV